MHTSRFLKAASLAIAGLITLHSTADAALVSITSDVADARVSSSGVVGDLGNYQNRVGEYFAPGTSSVVLPFLLTNPGGDNAIDTATFRFQLFTKDGIPADADLYGLGVRPDPTVLGTDFYSGPLDTTDATLIQQSILTNDTPLRIDPNTGFVTTSASGDLALASYLNSAFAGGANAGQYVFLRLSYTVDPAPAGNYAYNILTADAGGVNERPLLTYTTAVPEPATASAALLGAGVLLGVRRNRRDLALGAK